MKRIRILVLIALCVLAAAGGAALFIWSGIYDVAAIREHTRPVYRLIVATRDHAVDRRSADVEVPPLGDARQLANGLALFREHCLRCHGAPGVAPEPFALGLQPVATPLVHSGRDLPPQALYWVIRNGIKMTAMPAFEFRMSDQDMWDVVAFVMHLPSLSPAEYRALAAFPAKRSQSASGHAVDPERGRLAVGQYACTACHAIPGMVGPDARVGPSLHGIGSRLMLGGVLPNSPENMALWLRSPQSVAPLTAMPDLGVTERDARDMAAWLATLK